MTREFHYPPRVRKLTVGGMITGSAVILMLSLISLIVQAPIILSLTGIFIALLLLKGYFDFRVRLSPIIANEEGIWNSFCGIKKNYCIWSDLVRVINRPDWSIFLEGNTQVWILFSNYKDKKIKIVFDNNIEDYAELALLVTEQVGRRGIKIEGK
jgi:hypothetical protein